MAQQAEIEAGLDELYRRPPGEFTAARKELAAELRAEGDRDAAKEVAKLKRPTAAAALVNHISFEHPKEIKAFLDACAKVRKLQGRLGRSGSGKQLRAAAEAQRDAHAKLVELARSDGDASSSTLDRVDETFHAAASDEELARVIAAGRLDRERRVATLTIGVLEEIEPNAPAPDPKELREAKAAIRRAEAAAKRAKDVERRAGALVERARSKLRETEAALDEARAERKQRDADLESEKKRLKRLEQP